MKGKQDNHMDAYVRVVKSKQKELFMQKILISVCNLAL